MNDTDAHEHTMHTDYELILLWTRCHAHWLCMHMCICEECHVSLNKEEECDNHDEGPSFNSADSVLIRQG